MRLTIPSCYIQAQPLRPDLRSLPAFGGSSRVSAWGNHQTSLFRSPEVYRALPELLRTHFPQGAPIYCFAASDGSEPYSIAMSLLTRLSQEEAARFLPLKALDLNPALIEEAGKGLIGLSPAEVKRADRELPGDNPLSRFLRAKPVSRLKTCLMRMLNVRSDFEATPLLQGAVDFRCENIMPFSKNLSQIPLSRPAVVLFRNAWYHLGQAKSRTLAQDLFQNLPPGSLLVIGETELHGYCQASVQEILAETGFTPLKEGGGMIFKR